MKGTRSALLCLIVALVAGALVAPGAMASEYGPKEFPELGRCVKTITGAGTYKGANCQFVAAPGTGRYEWISATASEKLSFTAGGGEAILATLGHSTIKCVATNVSGEWLNEKEALTKIELQGCLDQQNHQCTNVAGQNKSEISGNVIGLLGFIKNVEKTVVVGIDFHPLFGQTALFTYECGGGPLEQNAVGGSVIARYNPIQSMKSTVKMVLNVTASGKQATEQFEGGLKDTLLTTYKQGLETTGEAPSTLKVKEILGTTSQKYEVRVKEVPFA